MDPWSHLCEVVKPSLEPYVLAAGPFHHSRCHCPGPSDSWQGRAGFPLRQLPPSCSEDGANARCCLLPGKQGSEETDRGSPSTSLSQRWACGTPALELGGLHGGGSADGDASLRSSVWQCKVDGSVLKQQTCGSHSSPGLRRL